MADKFALIGKLDGEKVYLESMAEVGEEQLLTLWEPSRDHAQVFTASQVGFLLKKVVQYFKHVSECAGEELPADFVKTPVGSDQPPSIP